MSAKPITNASPHPHNSASFAVDDVIPAGRPVWSETLAQSLARRFRRKILLLAESDNRVINSAMDWLSPDQRARPHTA